MYIKLAVGLLVAVLILGLFGMYAFGSVIDFIDVLSSNVLLFFVFRVFLSISILVYCVHFGVLGYSLAKRRGKNPRLRGWICGLTGVWGWLYLYFKKHEWLNKRP
jgi:hypothetical protein